MADDVEEELDAGEDFTRAVADERFAARRGDGIVGDGVDVEIVGLVESPLVVVFLGNDRDRVLGIVGVHLGDGFECACAVVVEDNLRRINALLYQGVAHGGRFVVAEFFTSVIASAHYELVYFPGFVKFGGGFYPIFKVEIAFACPSGDGRCAEDKSDFSMRDTVDVVI